MLFLQFLIASMVRATNSGAKPTEGSSTSRMRGASISARPSATICCSPPLRLPASCARRSARRGKVAKQLSRLRRICSARLAAEGAEQQVLFHRELREQAPSLGHERDSKIDDLFGRQLGQLVTFAVDIGDDAPGARSYDAHDALDQRALAVAVGAEQGHGFAGCDRQRHVLDDAYRAIAGMDALDGKAIGQDRHSPR